MLCKEIACISFLAACLKILYIFMYCIWWKLLYKVCFWNTLNVYFLPCCIIFKCVFTWMERLEWAFQVPPKQDTVVILHVCVQAHNNNVNPLCQPSCDSIHLHTPCIYSGLLSAPVHHTPISTDASVWMSRFNYSSQPTSTHSVFHSVQRKNVILEDFLVGWLANVRTVGNQNDSLLLPWAYRRKSWGMNRWGE